MRLRFRCIASVLVAFAMLPSADAQGLDAGLASVEVQMHPGYGCNVGVPGGPCLLGHDPGASLLPGDDRVALEQFVQEARVTASAPGAGDHEASFEPNDLVFTHPAFRVLNATAQEANHSLPAEARRFVTVDSREWGAEPWWGVFATLHFPATIAVPIVGYRSDGIALGMCWNLSPCPVRWYDQALLQSDEERLQLLPKNVWQDQWTTDDFVEGTVYGATDCEGLLQTELGCGVGGEARSSAAPAILLAQNSVPNFGTSFAFHRAVVSIESPTLPSATGVAQQVPAQDAAAGGSPLPASSAGSARNGARPEDTELAPTLEEPGRHRTARNTAGYGTTSVLGPTEYDSASLNTAMAVVGVVFLLGLLYHRIQANRALDQTNRRRIFDQIASEPGVKVGTLAQRLGLSYKTVVHHVRILHAGGLVVTTNRSHHRLFAAGQVSMEDARTLSDALSRPSARAIYGYLAENPAGTDLATLRRILGLAPATVCAATMSMRRAGLVECRREGRRVFIRAVRPLRVSWDIAVQSGGGVAAVAGTGDFAPSKTPGPTSE